MASRCVRSSVARGSMPYSLVTQPLPVPFRNPGTPSSTVAVQITRVLPSSIRTLPSALGNKVGRNFQLRIWSALRPSIRKVPPCSRIARKLWYSPGGVSLPGGVRVSTLCDGFCFGVALLYLFGGSLKRAARQNGNVPCEMERCLQCSC